MTEKEKFVLEHYDVTVDGKIFSHFTHKWLKFRQDKDGYFDLALVYDINGNRRPFRIHRLVALKYLPEIDGYTVTNHKNLNKQDNRLENLEWSTVAKNTQHGYDNSCYSNVKNIKITDSDGIIRIFPSGSHVARYYGYKCASQITYTLAKFGNKYIYPKGRNKGMMLEYTNEGVTTIERKPDTVIGV